MPPTISKRIICLANSRKLAGRCIAGKELLEDGRTGPWVRPVSARETEEVSEYERQYEDGSDPRVLDIIDVPLLIPRPKDYQPENWLLDPEHYWKLVRPVAWEDLGRYVDPVAQLWNNENSTFNGRYDYVPLSNARVQSDSLRLVRVNNLTLSVFAPGETFGNHKRRVQGRFHLGGVEYWLWVTDPEYERRYLKMADGTYPIGDAFLTVSLGEPYRNDCYKLIAAIIKP